MGAEIVDDAGFSAPLIQGNTADDDAQIFEDVLKANPNPPLPSGVTDAEALTPARAPTRLITGTVVIPIGATDPVQLFNKDVGRIDLTLFVHTDPAQPNDYIMVADDKARFVGVSSTARIYDQDATIPLPDHTGEMWAGTGGTNLAAITISWIGVV